LAGDNPSAIQLGLLEELCTLAVDSARHIDVPLIARLTGIFGTDRGVLIALMMKRVQLAPGEALFVATGVPHCYLEGLAIETMTSSDNVLRGGLTEKHVSAADFMAMLDTAESLDCAPSQATVLLRGLERYDFGSTDFSLHRIQVGGSNLLIDFGLPGESLLLCVEGELAISNSLDERLVLRRGEAAYLSADANFYSISGSGAGYLGSAA
jgi:mannose-6-phosphate isomerase